MKKTIVLLSGITLFCVNAHSQISGQLVGKKLQVTSSQNMTITVTQMGTETSMPMTTDTYADYEVKGVSGKNVQLSGMITRLKTSITVMGNENKFDSDDSSSNGANPQMEDKVKEIKKQKDFSVEIGKTPDMADIGQSQGIEGLASSLFYPFEKSATEGSKYSDSSKSESGSKFVTEYVVSKIDNNNATVMVTTTGTVVTATQQNGMDIKINLTLSATSTRVYDLSTGLLKTDTTNTNMSGTQEIAAAGISMPITIKGASTTTVL